MSHIFISYSRKDLDFASKIVQALAENNLDTWVDWKTIPKGEDWEHEIYLGIEEADSFLFLISPNSVASQMCNQEIIHAAKNGKRILPIVIRDADLKNIHSEISKRDPIFCRDGQDDFNKAIEETQKSIHTDYEWLKYHTELQIKALKWEQQKESSRLLRGKELQEIEQHLADIDSQSDPQPTRLQWKYVLAGRTEQDKRRHWVTSVLTIALVVMVTLSLFSLKERDNALTKQATAQAAITVAVAEVAAAQAKVQEAQSQATIARAGELAAQSMSMQDKNYPTSFLLGIEAYRTFDIPLTRSTLLNSVEFQPQLLQNLATYAASTRSVAFSPDGNTLATGSCGKMDAMGNCTQTEIMLWNAANGQRIGQPLVQSTRNVSSVIFSPDGKIVAVGNWGASITLWDVSTEQPIGQSLQANTTDVISNLAFSPDGKILASASGVYGTISLWNVATHQLIDSPLTGQSFGVHSLIFGSDGKTLLSLDWEDKLVVWDVMKHVQIRQTSPSRNSGLSSSTALSPDGTTAASAIQNGTIILWNVATAQLIGQPLERGSNSYITSLVFSAGGKSLASGSNDGTITIWDIAKSQPFGRSFKGHTKRVSSLSFSPDGDTLASGGEDGAAMIWAVPNQPSPSQRLMGHTDWVESVAFSPSGNMLASGSSDNTIILWDVATRKQIRQPLTGHTFHVYSIAFSPDGKTLVSGSWDGTIIMWNTETGRPIGPPLKGHTDVIYSVAFSPDGKTLASGSFDNSVILWDATTGKPIGQPLTGHTGAIYSVAFSPNGKILASGSADGTIILWDVATHQSIDSPLIGHNSYVLSVAFSPDGKILASGNYYEPVIILWDVATHQPIGQPLTGHTGQVFSVAFSPDGKTLASGSADDTIILWDITTGRSIGSKLAGHTSSVTSVAFSPDGNLVASGSWDKSVILWDLEPQSWIDKSCQRVGRNFTQGEWAQYFPNEEYRVTCSQWHQQDNNLMTSPEELDRVIIAKKLTA